MINIKKNNIVNVSLCPTCVKIICYSLIFMFFIFDIAWSTEISPTAPPKTLKERYKNLDLSRTPNMKFDIANALIDILKVKDKEVGRFIRKVDEIDGRLKFEVTGKIPDGIYWNNYDDGILSSEILFIGNKPKETMEYYYAGTLQKNTIYENDYSNFKTLNFSKNGKLIEEKNYVNWKIISSRSYDENGNLIAVPDSTNRIKEGVRKLYYEKGGQLAIEANYKDYKLEGIWKGYYENGELLRVQNYVNGELDGIMRIYDKNGEISSIDTYKKGIKINSKKYDTLGKEIMNQDYPYEPVFTVENMEQGLSDTLTTSFFGTKKFTVVERSKMKEILKEQVFQMTGSTTNEYAVKIGKMLNVKFVVISSIVKISKEFVINIRIINVESAELISAEMEKCYAEKELINSIQKLVQTVTDKTIEKYPEEKAIPIAVLDLQIN